MTDQPAKGAKSPHVFMAEALSAKARLLGQRRAFLGAALAAEDDALESGRGYRASDLDAYFNALAAEQETLLPRQRPWRK